MLFRSGVSADVGRAQPVFGADGGTRDFVSINKATGVGTSITKIPSPYTTFGLAFRGSNLYTWNQLTNRLMQLDPVTGNVLTTINLGIGNTLGSGGGDIAFRSDGIGFLSAGSRFYQFDITGPSSTLITNSLSATLTGLAFDSADVLYGACASSSKLFIVKQSVLFTEV